MIERGEWPCDSCRPAMEYLGTDRPLEALRTISIELAALRAIEVCARKLHAVYGDRNDDWRELGRALAIAEAHASTSESDGALGGLANAEPRHGSSSRSPVRRFDSGGPDQTGDDLPSLRVLVNEAKNVLGEYVELRALRVKVQGQRLELGRRDAEIARIARWVVQHVPGDFCDHACGECAPDGAMVVKQFRCVVHQARAILGRNQAAPSTEGGVSS